MNPEVTRLVERLRRTADAVVNSPTNSMGRQNIAIDLRQGANTIEDLSGRVTRLEAALEPFARFADVLNSREALAGPSPLFAIREEAEEARRVLRAEN